MNVKLYIGLPLSDPGYQLLAGSQLPPGVDLVSTARNADVVVVSSSIAALAQLKDGKRLVVQYNPEPEQIASGLLTTPLYLGRFAAVTLNGPIVIPGSWDASSEHWVQRLLQKISSSLQDVSCPILLEDLQVLTGEKPAHEQTALIVDAANYDLQAAIAQLSDRYDLTVVNSYSDAFDELERGYFNLVITEAFMPGEPYRLDEQGCRYIGHSIEVGRSIRDYARSLTRETEVIVLTEIGPQEHPASALLLRSIQHQDAKGRYGHSVLRASFKNGVKNYTDAINRAGI